MRFPSDRLLKVGQESAMGLVGGQHFTRILSMHPAKKVILAEMGALDQQKVFRVIEVLFEDTVEIP